MSTTYSTENLTRWIEAAEIDYLLHFVRAWIPFNAWYRHAVDAEARESDVIERIHSTNTSVRRSLVGLLGTQDNESDEFKKQVLLLHSRLGRCLITSRGVPISLTRIDVGDNLSTRLESKYSGVGYEVIRSGKGFNSQVSSKVTQRNGNVALNVSQPGWNAQEIEQRPEFKALWTDVNRNKLLEVYHKVHPKRMIGIVKSNSAGQPTVEGTPVDVFAGLVETLYRLRCVLMHGEVVPTKEVNSVYAPAYFILLKLLSGIK